MWNIPILDVYDSFECVDNVAISTLDILHDRLMSLLSFVMKTYTRYIGESSADRYSNISLYSYKGTQEEGVGAPSNIREMLHMLIDVHNKRNNRVKIQDRDMSNNDRDTRYQMIHIVDQSIQVVRFYKYILSNKPSLSYFNRSYLQQLSRIHVKDMVLHLDSHLLMNKYMLLMLIHDTSDTNMDHRYNTYTSTIPVCISSSDVALVRCINK